MPSRWKPNVTVAAIIDRLVDGRHEFLLVEEETTEGLRLNNPAGHLDPGETPQHGAEREAFEETACRFTPDSLVGIYMSWVRRPASGDDVTYLRAREISVSGESFFTSADGEISGPERQRTWRIVPSAYTITRA